MCAQAMRCGHDKIPSNSQSLRGFSIQSHTHNIMCRTIFWCPLYAMSCLILAKQFSIMKNIERTIFSYRIHTSFFMATDQTFSNEPIFKSI